MAVPVTVYVVDDDGDATGLKILEALKPVAGSQLKELAPLAERFVLAPLQMVAPPVILITGRGVTVTVNEAVLEHPSEVPVTV